MLPKSPKQRRLLEVNAEKRYKPYFIYVSFQATRPLALYAACLNEDDAYDTLAEAEANLPLIYPKGGPTAHMGSLHNPDDQDVVRELKIHDIY